jgi:hypothetical protein
MPGPQRIDAPHRRTFASPEQLGSGLGIFGNEHARRAIMLAGRPALI